MGCKHFFWDLPRAKLQVVSDSRHTRGEILSLLVKDEEKQMTRLLHLFKPLFVCLGASLLEELPHIQFAKKQTLIGSNSKHCCNIFQSCCNNLDCEAQIYSLILNAL